MNRKVTFEIAYPDRILSYFRTEVLVLIAVTVSGLVYNIGMAAGPYFEGQLVQYLYDIMNGKKTVSAIVHLAIAYVLVIAIVQGSRAVKRYSVRIFANDVSRSMRHVLYHSLVHMKKQQLEQEKLGSLMTKAISDVDACAEGMRKFTTEVFDTGVVMIVYLVMLLRLDWRLTLLALLFTPPAYLIADRLKKIVTSANAAYKKSASGLNQITMDRVSNAITYRVFGREDNRNDAYEQQLLDYEKKSTRANIFESSMAPIYDAIAMIGAVLILYFGSRNVTGTGWAAWNLASFTTYLACFTKLSTKTSHAAKLFNAVQKAEVSWKRIQPLMKYAEDDADHNADSRTMPDADSRIMPGTDSGTMPDADSRITPGIDSGTMFSADSKTTEQSICNQNPEDPDTVDRNAVCLTFDHVTCGYDEHTQLRDISFTAKQGEIIGITGMVACGKSMLGKVLIDQVPWSGSIQIDPGNFATLTDGEKHTLITYQGHEPELLSTTILENVTLGDTVNSEKWLRAVCLQEEVEKMPEKELTAIGMDGTQLSGGQQARLALARTLSHAGAILVLDDPFAAVDKNTETEILKNIRELLPDRVILLISHRLTHFPEMDHVLFLHDGTAEFAEHDRMMQLQPEYAALYEKQMMGGDLDDER